MTFWYNHYSPATVHPFLYVHSGFWTLGIAIRPNWNKYHNMTNAPTSLHLSQTKRISDSHYFFLFFTNSTLQHWPNYISLLESECKLVCRVLWSYKIWNLIGQYRSRGKVMLLGNQIYLNRQIYLFSCYLFLPFETSGLLS